MNAPDGLTVTRIFHAPRALVFEAWTNPKHFAQWFGGNTVDIPVESVAMDVRPGGSWKATMLLPDDGGRIDWIGEFVEVDPPARLVMTISDGPEDREVVTVVLAEVDGGTEMVCHQGGGHLTAEQYEQTRIGYEAFFDALADLVEV